MDPEGRYRRIGTGAQQTPDPGQIAGETFPQRLGEARQIRGHLAGPVRQILQPARVQACLRVRGRQEFDQGVLHRARRFVGHRLETCEPEGLVGFAQRRPQRLPILFRRAGRPRQQVGALRPGEQFGPGADDDAQLGSALR